MDADVARLEIKRLVITQSRRDQILNDLMLRIDPHRASARQFLDVQSMWFAAESNIDGVVLQSFLLQTIADARVDHGIDGALFQHACPHAFLDILSGPVLDNNSVDAGIV